MKNIIIIMSLHINYFLWNIHFGSVSELVTCSQQSMANVCSIAMNQQNIVLLSPRCRVL